MKNAKIIFQLLFLLCSLAWAEASENVPVESISLNISSIELNKGGYTQLTATILPEEATNQNIIWTSSLPKHISVSYGWVDANAEGIAIITATTADGEYVATCEISCTIEDAANINLVNLTEKMSSSISDEDATVEMYVPYDTDLLNISPSFQLSPGATISPDPATISNYSSTVNFTITAKDGKTTKEWSVDIKEMPDLSNAEEYTLQFDSSTAPNEWIDTPTTWYDNDIRLNIVSAYEDGTPSCQINEGRMGLFPASLFINTKNAGKRILAVEFDLFENCGLGCTTAEFYPDENSIDLPAYGSSTILLIPVSPADSLRLTSSESEFYNIKLWLESNGDIIQHTPIANAGTDLQVAEGDTVWLDGTASSDQDDDSLSFIWRTSDIELIQLKEPTSPKPYFIAPKVESDTEFEIFLTVKDSSSTSNEDAVTITIINVLHAPVAIAGNDTTLYKGDYLFLDASKSYDIDGDKLTYQWMAPKGIDIYDDKSETIGFTIPFENTQPKYDIILFVSDTDDSISSDTVTITINFENRKPIADAGYPMMGLEGEITMLMGYYSTDPDGDTLYYSWIAPSIVELDDSTGWQPTFTTPEIKRDTTVYFYLTVFDGQLYSDMDTLEVFFENVNETPTAAIAAEQIESIPTIICTENQNFELDGTPSSDPEEGKLTYSWSLPSEFNIGNDTLPSQTVTAPEVSENTTYQASLTVSDGELESTLQFDILVNNTNLKPIAVAGEDLTIIEGDTAFLDGSASYDPEKVKLTYDWSCLTKLSSTTVIDPCFRTPEVTKDSTIKVSLTVSDGVNISTSDTMHVLVKNVNKEPVLNLKNNPIHTFKENESITIETLIASDPDGDKLTFLWSIPQTLKPTGITTASPSITTPEVTSITPYLVSVTVSDGDLESKLIFTIYVEDVNKAPVADAGADFNTMSNNLVNLDGSASYDLDENSLTYSWTAPEGITLSNSSVAKPSFTCPNVSEITEYQFVLSVSDELLFARDTVIITCYPKQALVSLTVGVNEQLISADFFKLIMYQLVDNRWISSFPKPFKVSNDSCYYLISEGEWMLSVASATPEFNFIATYFGNTSNWADANTIKVTNDQINHINIACILPKSIETGPGIISGIIYNYVNMLKSVTLLDERTTEAQNPPAVGVNILLYSKADSSLLGSTLTNNEGQFSFANLPLGSYYLEVQLPGYENAEAFNVEISNETQSQSKINFAIDTVNHTITDVESNIAPSITIYPNPFTSNLTIGLEEQPSTTATVIVLDIYGQTIVSQPLNNKTNNIYLNFLPQGVYLIQIVDGKQIVSTTKVIKQ